VLSPLLGDNRDSAYDCAQRDDAGNVTCVADTD
jgi:hypothetical protein